MQQKTDTSEEERSITTESILPKDKMHKVQKTSTTETVKRNMMKNRSIQSNETVILSGPVHIEDRNQAEKGHVLLKSRWAVLCPSRILLFKSERHTHPESQ